MFHHYLFGMDQKNVIPQKRAHVISRKKKEKSATSFLDLVLGDYGALP